MSFDASIKLFEFLSAFVTTVGLPFAIGTFILQKRKDQKSEEENTFHQLDESYVSFLQLCLANPDLDIFSPPIGETYKPSEEQLRREHAIFGILISLFERAHVMFRGKSSEFRGSQWDGWVEYMGSYCYRANFEQVWERIGSQFDKQFYDFMQKLIEQSKAAHAKKSSSP